MTKPSRPDGMDDPDWVNESIFEDPSAEKAILEVLRERFLAQRAATRSDQLRSATGASRALRESSDQRTNCSSRSE